MLTIAQITDLHITTDADPVNRRRNEERLGQVLKSIHALRPRPTAIFATGDLVDRGELEEFQELRRLLDGWGIPIYFALGNHDSRATFLEVFEGPFGRTDENGFVQYAVDFGPCRVVVLDTLDEGSSQGGFCERRAAWLARTLDSEPDRPTAVMLHHPPIPSGIRWMDPDPQSPWIRRLHDVLAGREQVRALLCGHLHRGFTGVFAGHIVTAAPATSIQLTLDLTEVDMTRPDGREILLEEPPGFALLRVEEGLMVTHICVGGDYRGAVTYNFPFRRQA